MEEEEGEMGGGGGGPSAIAPNETKLSRFFFLFPLPFSLNVRRLPLASSLISSNVPFFFLSPPLAPYPKFSPPVFMTSPPSLPCRERRGLPIRSVWRGKKKREKKKDFPSKKGRRKEHGEEDGEDVV